MLAIIESNASRAGQLRALTEQAGFRTIVFAEATAALRHLRTRSCNLVILGMDGACFDPYDLCREISRLAPVIAVARACVTETCVRALECGADDCVIGATSGRELAARIHSVLRRVPTGEPARDVSISIDEMRVRNGGITYNLSRGEAELLAVLLRYAPTPVDIHTLTSLLQARRGTVESRIKSVRTKLGPGRLVSRGRLGYELVGV